MRNEAASSVVRSKPNQEAKKKKESETSKSKGDNKTYKRVPIECISSIILLKQRRVQTARGDGQGAVRDAWYVWRRSVALLMSADAIVQE